MGRLPAEELSRFRMPISSGFCNRTGKLGVSVGGSVGHYGALPLAEPEPFVVAPKSPRGSSFDAMLQHEWDVYNEGAPTGHHGRFWFSCTKGCGKSFQSRELMCEHSAICGICQVCRFDLKKCLQYPCQCCVRCGFFPCKCCPRCHHYPCQCCPRCHCCPCECEAPKQPKPKPKEEKKKKKVVIKGGIKARNPVISLAPSPFTFYKPTTKFDSKPRAARADGDTWGDLERAVEMNVVSEEEERPDTIQLKDFRAGMHDKPAAKHDLSMAAELESPAHSPANSPKLGPKSVQFE